MVMEHRIRRVIREGPDQVRALKSFHDITHGDMAHPLRSGNVAIFQPHFVVQP